MSKCVRSEHVSTVLHEYSLLRDCIVNLELTDIWNHRPLLDVSWIVVYLHLIFGMEFVSCAGQ
jgi:hypothetical protein